MKSRLQLVINTTWKFYLYFSLAFACDLARGHRLKVGNLLTWCFYKEMVSIINRISTFSSSYIPCSNGWTNIVNFLRHLGLTYRIFIPISIRLFYPTSLKVLNASTVITHSGKVTSKSYREKPKYVLSIPTYLNPQFKP